MQECRECGMYLIVGLSADLSYHEGNDPLVICLNCGATNVPKDSLEHDYSDEEDTTDITAEQRDFRDPADWRCT